MTALILQARLDSSRLPGKSLLPLGGEPLIFRVMEALAGIPCGIRILACPRDCETSFKPLAERAGFELFTGPKEDVLARFCGAVRRYGPDKLIRATGDNPFVFADAAETLAGEAALLDADYAGYAGLPLGAGVEALKAEALLRAEQEASDQAEREHVSPYLYNHPGFFRLHRPLAPLCWQDPVYAGGTAFRLTVDTPEDYRRAQKRYSILNKKRENSPGYRGAAVLEAGAL
jgi:spore coat polysaccharide biosynthesis protein SpsF